jgi:glucan phosphoethanolaminetransferase (alkaline phosphatase superfamily)
MGFIGVTLVFNVYHLRLVMRLKKKDEMLQNWLKDPLSANMCSFSVVMALSTVTTFKVFKMLISRFFGFAVFDLRLKSVKRLKKIVKLTIWYIISVELPIILLSATIIVKGTSKTQAFVSALDTLVVTVFCAVVSICESKKDHNFFEKIYTGPMNLNPPLMHMDSRISHLFSENQAEDQSLFANCCEENKFTV